MLTIRIAILLVNGVIRVREGRLTEAWRGRPYNSYVKKKCNRGPQSKVFQTGTDLL